MTNKKVKPFLKWVGGKRQLLKQIDQYIPTDFGTYYEPFLGGGAMLFHLQPKKAFVGDINKELTTTYQVIREQPEELIQHLQQHINTSEYYYEMRSKDRTDDFAAWSALEKASRFIYLNKTCYNGLYRVNNAGEVNTPFGKYKNPLVCDATTIYAVSSYLNDNDVAFSQSHYGSLIYFYKPQKNDFVYLDPPYVPLSTTSFTGYSPGGFALDEHYQMEEVIDELTERGVKVMLSNSNTSFVRSLYREYTIVELEAKRSINSNGKGRGKIKELLIMNY